MPSPFPGMDPYLEDPWLWPDVHHRLISIAGELLGAQLRPKYYARIETREYLSGDVDIHEAHLKIVDRDQRQVMTVLEIVSPANKVPDARGRASYQEKRREVLGSPCHFVEIDLLRDGQPFWSRELLPLCEYTITVSQAQRRPNVLVWPFRLSQRLPVVPVPLRSGDPDAKLDLQEVLSTAYARAGYDLEIDYAADPTPPWSAELAGWADELLKGKGVR